MTLKNLSFTADGYEIIGGPLFMHGTPAVSASMSATLKSAVTNSGVWAKSGGGTLVLDPGAGGTNTLYALKAVAGTLHLASGRTLVTQSGSNPESGPAFWVSGGTLVLGGGVLKTTGGAYARVSDYGHLMVTNGLCDLTGNLELLQAFNSPSTTTVSGSGVLDVQQLRVSQNTLAANLSVLNINTGGIIRLNAFGLDSGALRNGTVKFNGGTVVAKADNANFFSTGVPNWSNIVAKVMEGGAVVDSNGKYITIKHPLLSGAALDGGITKQGNGVLSLRGANTFNGGTFIYGGGVNFTSDGNLGALPSLPATNITFVTGGTLQAGASGANVHANRSILIALNQIGIVDSQTYTQTIYSAISGKGRLRKLGTGVTRLDPGDGSGFSVDTLDVGMGELQILSGTNLVTIASGGVASSGFLVAGGTLLVGGGYTRTTGGGYAATKNGALIITNGVVNLSTVELLNAYSGTGNITVSHSGVLDLTTLRISQNGGGADSNVINVNTGGTIRVHRFYVDEKTAARGRVNLNGGTLVAKSSRADFMMVTHSNFTAYVFFTVREGGAVVDSNGFDVDCKQELYSGAAHDGGVTKRGLARLHSTTPTPIMV
ncbi:MAG: hypothetical protein PHO37_15235 [Kiritimatiellae bacterium]|nr:hypothetical protein [Kiritimatiellia bacterium]